MSRFLLMVQTGLIMSVSISGDDRVKLSDYKTRTKQREPLYIALDDAAKVEQVVWAKRSVIVGVKQAQDFVKWATVGTEYEWIKKIVGARLDRSY